MPVYVKYKSILWENADQLKLLSMFILDSPQNPAPYTYYLNVILLNFV